MRVRRALAAAGLGSVAVLIVTVAPAAASGSFTAPAEGKTVSTAPTVTGSESMSQPIASLTLTADDGHGHTDTVTGHCGDPGFSCGSGNSSMTFSWQPNLPYNGRYTVTGQAEGEGTLLDAPASESLPALHFGVAVPPIAPRTVTASVSSSRVVTVSWRPNPEPDLTAYLIYRSIDGGDVRAIGQVPAGNGRSTSFTDTGSTQAGGRYAYQVVAVRPDADRDASTGVASNPSSPGRATVPAPPPGETTTTAGSDGGGGTAGASSGGAASSGGSVIAVPRAGRIDLSGFRALESAATIPPPPQPGDPGFKPTLPYAPSTTAAPADVGSGSALPAEPLGRDTGGRRALLGFVAGAMILFLVSMHLRWVLRRAAEVSG